MRTATAHCNSVAHIVAVAVGLTAWLSTPARAGELPFARDYDAIVVGAGPAGHAAVREALRAGARNVLHLDNRSEMRERPQMFFLEPATVRRLTEEDVDVLDPTRSTPVGSHTRIDTVDGVDRVLDRKDNPAGRLERAAAGKAPRGILGMLLHRTIPAATIPIQTLEHAQQEPDREDARVTVVYGAEVLEAHQQGRNAATAVFRWNGSTHRAHATVVGLAVGSRSQLLRDLGVKRRQVGKTVLPIRLVLVDQPGHDIVGRRARVRDLRLPEGFPLDGDAPIRILHMGWEGGERGRTAMLVELPPGTGALADAERVRLTDAAKSLAGLRGATLGTSEFTSTMTRSDRLFVTRNVVLLGDGVQTTAPHVGMGMNIAVMQGRFFGNLWRDLTAARTGLARRNARARFATAMRASRFGLHTYSKVFLAAYLPLDRPVSRRAGDSRRGDRSRARSARGDTGRPNSGRRTAGPRRPARRP